MIKHFLRKTISQLSIILDYLTRPKQLERSEEECRKLARETRGISLYDYKGCSRSLRARREIHRLNLDIERRDILSSSIHQDNLLAEFGQLKAPCLRVEERGQVHWLDEPEEIITYLHQRFNKTSDAAGLMF